MSEITDLLKEYRAGAFDFNELKKRLKKFPFKPLPPSFFEDESLTMTEAAMLTDETDFDFKEGTIEEVEMAWLDDLLTDDEFFELDEILPIVSAKPPKNFRIYDPETGEYDVDGFLGRDKDEPATED